MKTLLLYIEEAGFCGYLRLCQKGHAHFSPKRAVICICYVPYSEDDPGIKLNRSSYLSAYCECAQLENI